MGRDALTLVHPTRWAVLLAGLGAAHALVVATLYHVGSFDDDASYVLAARALGSGTGLTGPLIPGVPLIGLYPPGYPALLAPVAAVWPGSLVALRAPSLVLFLAIFPLTWVYLGRRNVGPAVRLAILALLALDPVPATYATMVMPEIPFVVAFLLLLLVADRWESEHRGLTWAGAGTVVAAATLVWFKEAGVGLVIGLAAWFLIRRHWRKALSVCAGTALLLLPVVIARANAGVALIGSRYSADFGGAYAGGLLGRSANVVPHGGFTFLTSALPASLTPLIAGPLPGDGPIGLVLGLLQLTATPLTITGYVAWSRQHRDATTVAVPIYLLATLTYPFVNERRVILVLPVIVTWYVLGAHLVTRTITRRSRSASRAVMARAGRAVPVTVGAVIVAILIGQVDRDYLNHVGQQTSSPGGSPYMAFLRAAGTPPDVVETDYRWTMGLFGGHRSANTAFVVPCDDAAIVDAIHRDRASYLLSAALNRPGLILSPCVLPLLAARTDAIRLYRTARDMASVFEFIGPGSPHPGVRDVTPVAELTSSPPTVSLGDETPQQVGDPAGRYPTVRTDGGSATLTWAWPAALPVTQVSLSGAGAGPAPATVSVVVDILGADGMWRDIARSVGPVGEGASTSYVLVHFDQPMMATAVRVTVAGHGTAAVHDLHVLASGA